MMDRFVDWLAPSLGLGWRRVALLLVLVWVAVWIYVAIRLQADINDGCWGYDCQETAWRARWCLVAAVLGAPAARLFSQVAAWVAAGFLPRK